MHTIGGNNNGKTQPRSKFQVPRPDTAIQQAGGTTHLSRHRPRSGVLSQEFATGMLEIVACSPCHMSQANPCCSRAGGVRLGVDRYPCVCRKKYARLGLVAVRKGVPGRQLTSRRPIPVCLSSDPGRWIELTTTCRARLNSLCYCSATQGSSGPRQSHPSRPGQAHRPNSRTSSSSRGAAQR